MRANKEHLIALEKTGEYLFHGSIQSLELLEPRQAFTLGANKKEMIEDGNPCVACTQYAELAIFRALANRSRISGHSRSEFSLSGGKLSFRATANLLKAASNEAAIGYVYVFRKEGSEPYRGFEYRFYQTMKPLEAILVTGDDIPKEVELMETT